MHYLILMHTCPIYQLHVLQSNMYYYHHNLMPVILVHVAGTIHARSGSTGVANPTTASINPLLCANNPLEISGLQIE